jgi:hypothetical protein
VRPRLKRAYLAVGVLVAVGCRADGAGGTLRARWASADTTLGAGDLALPLKVAWCESRGRLTLLGVSGDTGVGILVRTVELVPGLFGVSDTTAARSPGSSVAFRMAKEARLFALSGDSGAVAITSVQDGRLTGRFVAWFSRPDAGPALVSGSFKGASAMPDTVRCEPVAAPPPVAPAPPDSGVS